ncbi:MAG: hypothetical protein ACI8WY_002294 [Planctomycetota bacterium]|jgi:peptidylprolyl isomerase
MRHIYPVQGKALLAATLVILGSCASPEGREGPALRSLDDITMTDRGAEAPAPQAGPSIKAMGPWQAGDMIAPGMPGVNNIEILQVHANGSGDVCGSGRRATLRYVAMLADGKVIDPGTRPFTFRVGSRRAIAGWDVVVAKMRVGDSLTLMLPQELAYGPSKGDLKFDMELLSFE